MVANAVQLDADGKAIPYVTLGATPPAVNWVSMHFAVKNLETNEIHLGVGDPSTGSGQEDGSYRATISGLRLAKPHQALVWATNTQGLEGTVATANFTSAGWEQLPSAPQQIVVAAGTGKSIRVDWVLTPIPANLQHFELQRNGAHLGFFATTGAVDQAIAYGVAYTYRVRTIDRTDNASADWRTAAPFTLTANITQPDLTEDSIGPPQLQDDSVTEPAIGEEQVTTPKLPLGAVSNGVSASAVATTAIDTSYETKVSAAFEITEGVARVTMSTALEAMAIGGTTGGDTPAPIKGACHVWAQVKRGSTIIWGPRRVLSAHDPGNYEFSTPSSTTTSGVLTVVVRDAAAAGIYTYSLELTRVNGATGGSAEAADAHATIEEFKR